MKVLQILLVYALSLISGQSGLAIADEYRPAYLQLKQASPDTWDVLWKVPAKGQNRRLEIDVEFSDDVIEIVPARTTFVGNAFIQNSVLQRIGGLKGTMINIAGLGSTSTEVLVRIEPGDGDTEVMRLTPAQSSFTVKGNPELSGIIKTYLVFGIEHILQGVDHLLFVACLVFISGSWRRLLATITGFTIAHSITLTLAAIGKISVPMAPIEAAIALSIVFLAREIACDRRDTLSWQYPVAVSSIFGLLHGFGFASALGEIGLPQNEIPAALLAFNLGVELGQIMFVCVLLNLFWISRIVAKIAAGGHREKFPYTNRIIACFVGGLAMFWTMQRVASF